MPMTGCRTQIRYNILKNILQRCSKRLRHTDLAFPHICKTWKAKPKQTRYCRGNREAWFLKDDKIFSISFNNYIYNR
jgi:hypothetical protein